MRLADFCPFDLLMTCPYNSQCRGENKSKRYDDIAGAIFGRCDVCIEKSFPRITDKPSDEKDLNP